MTAEAFDETAERLLRDLAPRVLGAVVRRCGDFAAAEDAVQEALLAAFSSWRRDGLPENPGGWLFQVASRRLQDERDAERARRRREQDAASETRAAAPDPVDDALRRDDTLVLLFLCCHPALTTPSAIALTLRAVGGLTTGEIASAFLVPETTMAQRISRAKTAIQASHVPFELPEAAERTPRLAAVLHVVYLIFNEGYASSGGAALQRVELAREAIRLARILHGLLPEDAEVAGLLALMLLTDARRKARTDAAGALVPLMEQDRSSWDREAIAEGTAILVAAFQRGAVGPYQLQAAIAALHDDAATPEATDWPQILGLYDVLRLTARNPVVELNRAVAVAMVHGPKKGLEEIEALAAEPALASSHRLSAARAHLHEMAGDHDAAIRDYDAAAAATTSLSEQHYLLTKAARLRQHRNSS